MLDLAAYPRRAHFDYFRQMANPYVSVTAAPRWKPTFS